MSHLACVEGLVNTYTYWGSCSWRHHWSRDRFRIHESSRRCPYSRYVLSRYPTPLIIQMDLWLVSMDACWLKCDSMTSQLLSLLQLCVVVVSCLQETHFDSNFRQGILSNVYKPYSVYFEGRARGVSWLINRNLNATSSFVFSDPVGKLCVERYHLWAQFHQGASWLFRCIEPFVTLSRQVCCSGRLERHLWSRYRSRKS